VSVPGEFFTGLAPQIRSVVELKVTLHLMWVLSRRAGVPRCIEYRELLADEPFVKSLRIEEGPRPAEDYLREGLELAVTRGAALQVLLKRGPDRQVWFFLNTDASREAVASLKAGEFKTLQDALGRQPIDEVRVYRPNAFALYEQNIGTLTPMIAELLRAAETQYPVEWIEEAMRTAVAYNRRSWRYIETILQRWEAEGKSEGRDELVGEPSDPTSYFRTKYAHLYK